MESGSAATALAMSAVNPTPKAKPARIGRIRRLTRQLTMPLSRAMPSRRHTRPRLSRQPSMKANCLIATVIGVISDARRHTQISSSSRMTPVAPITAYRATGSSGQAARPTPRPISARIMIRK